MSSNTEYSVIGLMSGTSLDGLDIACCTFSKKEKWEYRIERAETISYDQDWLQILQRAHELPAEELIDQHFKFGKFLGEQARTFIQRNKLNPGFISSHGHTVYHQPGKGFTFQLGAGAAIAAAAGIPVVSDFRSLDVALGGQGAPLVPVGDQLLFSDFDYCLNLGGIANISRMRNGNPHAFDICVCNQALNYLANKLGKEYDENGELASQGKIDSVLLNLLNEIPYYQLPPPKSLGREDVERDILPLLNESRISTENKLRTICEHIAIQVANAIPGNKKNERLLISGGGALNSFLVSCLRSELACELEVPETAIIQFKEALVFAFLGLLRWRNEINCLASVTGASRDSVSGSIYLNA